MELSKRRKYARKYAALAMHASKRKMST